MNKDRSQYPKALLLAGAYIEQLNKQRTCGSEVEWKLDPPTKTARGFYFEYVFHPTENNNLEGIGGAAGFLVDTETEKIIDVSWADLHTLGLE